MASKRQLRCFRSLADYPGNRNAAQPQNDPGGGQGDCRAEMPVPGTNALGGVASVAASAGLGCVGLSGPHMCRPQRYSQADFELGDRFQLRPGPSVDDRKNRGVIDPAASRRLPEAQALKFRPEIQRKSACNLRYRIVGRSLWPVRHTLARGQLLRTGHNQSVKDTGRPEASPSETRTSAQTGGCESVGQVASGHRNPQQSRTDCCIQLFRSIIAAQKANGCDASATIRYSIV
ncbi:hypothetical protein SAMN06296378_2030 [Salinibacterium xinjiangense]|uniref:Uncharacterized protein n=1 Tax=Salinibacterium xinjiangense TaxID=386302 RepID=A0A2C8ZVG0_9MICO|nr:hypothetical protein SAMN06296378_2030 [Salinibacterium xinjiangense]